MKWDAVKAAIDDWPKTLRFCVMAVVLALCPVGALGTLIWWLVTR